MVSIIEKTMSVTAGGKMNTDKSVRENIMVVDDDNDILLILNDFLTKEGYSVITAKNGEEAVEKVKKNKIDLVLMDIAMPKLNGTEAIKEIRKVKPKMPYIMITACHDSQNLSVNNGSNSNGNASSDCFFKPFDLTYLLRSVKAKLRSRTSI